MFVHVRKMMMNLIISHTNDEKTHNGNASYWHSS